MSHVSHHWYQLIVNCAPMWTIIDVNSNIQTVKMALERSKEALVEARMGYRGMLTLDKRKIGLREASMQSSRWVKAHFLGYIEELNCFRLAPAPKLQDLYIVPVSASENPGERPTDIFMELPSLEKLHLGWWPGWDRKHMPNLRHLMICEAGPPHATLSEIFRMLEGCPLLEVLEIGAEVEIGNELSGPLPIVPTVELPNLQRLDLIGWSVVEMDMFFRAVSLPTCTIFNLKGGTNPIDINLASFYRSIESRLASYIRPMVDQSTSIEVLFAGSFVKLVFEAESGEKQMGVVELGRFQWAQVMDWITNEFPTFNDLCTVVSFGNENLGPYFMEMTQVETVFPWMLRLVNLETVRFLPKAVLVDRVLAFLYGVMFPQFEGREFHPWDKLKNLIVLGCQCRYADGMARILEFAGRKKSESVATTATLHQILPCDQAPVLAPPPPGEDNLTKSPGPDQNIDQLFPLLNWNFTSSSALGAEDDVGVFDDDYDEDLWWNAEDDETIQLKEVSRGVVPFPSPAEHEAEEDEDVVQLTSTPAPTFGPGIRPLIPTGQLNPNIESLEIRSNQEAIGFPSSDDEEDEATAPTSPPAPRGKPRIRLQVPAEKPRPTIELLQSRPGHNSIPFPSREGEDGDDDDDDQALRQRRPSFTRPSRPLPPTPTAWRSSSLGRMHGPTPLPVCLEEEEEEEESDQDQLPLPTSNPSPDTSTSSTSTAVEPYTNASGKPSAMKKVKGPRKMATVSFLHFKEVRDLPVTICDWKSRRRFVSEEEEELDVEHRMLENLSGSEVEEAEEVTWLPLEQSVPQSQPSLLSPGGEPQNHAAVERASRGTRLRKMLTKMSPLRFGKRLFKKKTGPL
ncbi:hypothetical protein FS837_005236 [Tulasnella sp. UAMH 9824]|nr:hypothetical protein FS837_005236 [Tulasnella sp. UAMH 9824]